MNFYARNKNLVIKLEEEKQEKDSGILIPEDYQKTKLPGMRVAKLLSASGDSQFSYDIGDYIMFESHMMQSFQHNGKTFTVVPESSVYGVFKNGPDYSKNNEY